MCCCRIVGSSVVALSGPLCRVIDPRQKRGYDPCPVLLEDKCRTSRKPAPTCHEYWRDWKARAPLPKRYASPLPWGGCKRRGTSFRFSVFGNHPLRGELAAAGRK